MSEDSHTCSGLRDAALGREALVHLGVRGAQCPALPAARVADRVGGVARDLMVPGAPLVDAHPEALPYHLPAALCPALHRLLHAAVLAHSARRTAALAGLTLLLRNRTVGPHPYSSLPSSI